MNSKKLRTIIPLIVLVIAGIGFVFNTGFGDLSALGWSSVSLLCPLGALGTMLASKTVVPRAIISLVIAIVAIFILGRAFCGWICPVPVLEKLRTAFARKKPSELAEESAAKKEITAELTEKEKKMLRTACGTHVCAPENRPSDSRLIVLAGGLLSAAIFGFPVFCLICPIGLSFALVFVLIQLFGAGDLTWSVIVIPVLLIVEVVVFRKWCSHICPLSALMSLIGKVSKTFRPTVNASICVETRGGECGRCSQVCPVGIDPRHPEKGTNFEECTKCRACVENCPASAISMPLWSNGGVKEETLPVPETTEK